CVAFPRLATFISFFSRLAPSNSDNAVPSNAHSHASFTLKRQPKPTRWANLAAWVWALNADWGRCSEPLKSAAPAGHLEVNSSFFRATPRTARSRPAGQRPA